MQNSNISQFDFEQCQKCSICVSVCPMHEVNPLYQGPKQAGPDGERYRLKDPAFFDYTLKFCLGCRRCEVACPSGVKVADLIANAKLQFGKKSHPLRDWTLANTDLVGSLSVPFATMVNSVLGWKPVPEVMDRVLAVDKRRTFPSYANQTFADWFGGKDCPSQEGFTKYVTYFHGCYVNYNYPELGRTVVALMNRFGYGVRLAKGEKCCGVALISGGFKGQAKKQARRNVEVLGRSMAEGSEAIIASSSSCTLNMREEYPELLGVDNSSVRDAITLATKFIYEKIESGEFQPRFKPGFKARYAYHTACHMQRLGWQPYSIKLLQMIPGLDLKVLPQECCGISGTFGFKKENYGFSQKIGSKLFTFIRKSGVQAVACDCETCKWQIEMSTGKKVYNPLEIFLAALEQ